MDVQALQAALGHDFASRELLQQALTHRSHSVAHNERLEFLGDSVLNCVIASLLFEKFARIDEGDLSRLRANLVKQQSLYEIAQRLELSPYLRLGEGELKSGGFRRPSILADTVEALFGAVFLDAGFDAARRVIRKLYLPVLETVDPKTLGKDAKTLLQEYLQGRKIALPVYTVVATHGAAHSQEFEVECTVPKLAIQVSGAGGSRRAAEQAAAKKALEAAQAMAVAATKRSRRAKPAQLSLAVAVEQTAEPPSTVRKGESIDAAARAPKAVPIEPARIVAATISRDASARPDGKSKAAEPKAVEPGAGDAGVSPRDSSTSGVAGPKPADVKPADVKPAEPKPMDTKSMDTKSTDTKSNDTKAMDPSQTDTKSTDTKSTDAKPTEAKPTEAKPTEAKPTEAKPTDTKSIDTKAMDTKPTEPKPTEARFVDSATISADGPVLDRRPVDGQQSAVDPDTDADIDPAAPTPFAARVA